MRMSPPAHRHSQKRKADTVSEGKGVDGGVMRRQRRRKAFKWDAWIEGTEAKEGTECNEEKNKEMN